MKDRILIVDDLEINRLILREILSNDYEVLEAENGLQAVEVLYNAMPLPQAVLLDIMMPEMEGFEVLGMIKANQETEKIPVLFITAADAEHNETRGLTEGAVDYISKPFNPSVVKARVDNHIQLKRYRAELEDMVEKKTAELMRTHETMLEALATIIEYRSLESGTHIRRSTELGRLLINHMLPDPAFHNELITLNCNSIVKAMSLHDIGKIGIPDSILLKPGKLTPEEFEVIKQHAVIGGDIIDTISASLPDDAQYLRHCKDICRWHHERWDGTGYPDGLAGEDIPLSARISSVVDVYDALMNKRCYKAAMSHDEAIEVLRRGSGAQFDPRIIRIVMDIEPVFRCLEEQMADPA
ncbi:MAG: response regulator [Oscillospiraceae bacterium]|jgi:putative two-component system response regulator|nr:response regulator [Oscillospiraceae bacterium]